MNSRFEIYTDVGRNHRWRLKAGNGEIVATSEGYSTRYAAKHSAEKMRQWAGSYAVIIEIN